MCWNIPGAFDRRWHNYLLTRSSHPFTCFHISTQLLSSMFTLLFLVTFGVCGRPVDEVCCGGGWEHEPVILQYFQNQFLSGGRGVRRWVGLYAGLIGCYFGATVANYLAQRTVIMSTVKQLELSRGHHAMHRTSRCWTSADDQFPDWFNLRPTHRRPWCPFSPLPAISWLDFSAGFGWNEWWVDRHCLDLYTECGKAAGTGGVQTVTRSTHDGVWFLVFINSSFPFSAPFHQHPNNRELT